MEKIICSDYDLLFGDRYRKAPKGDSSPMVQKWIDFEKERKAKRSKKSKVKSTVNPQTATPQAEEKEVASVILTERQKAIVKALNEYYGENLGEGQKHPTFCQQTSHWLCWVSENDPKVAIAMARELDYVKNWRPQPNEVEELIQSASSKIIMKKTPKELKDLLERARPQMKSFDVDDDKRLMADGSNWMSVTWNGDAKWAIDEARNNVDLQYIVPMEGSDCWMDCWAIPACSKNTEAASYWINFMCRPDIALLCMEETGYSSAIATPEILKAVTDRRPQFMSTA